MKKIFCHDCTADVFNIFGSIVGETLGNRFTDFAETGIVLYDPISNSLYVSSMGAGSIVRFSTDGKLIKNDWITGLTSNKGSAIFKGLLYTAETSSVAVRDVAKASVIKHIQVEGSQMLNDLAVDSKGIIYVSDSRGAKVYRIEGDKPVVYLENLQGVNGLLPVNTDLYILTSTSVVKADKNKK
jgi:sugar lactone lactonase YvrE